MSIRLSAAQYAAALDDIDARTFVVVDASVSLPVAENGTVTWRDFYRGDVVTGVARIFAVAAINENEISASSARAGERKDI